jgi:hypothetical protein
MRSGASVPPSIAWGLGVGLAIAAIDALALVLTSTAWAGQWLIANGDVVANVDFVANIVLYSLIGYSVGRATGAVREAAEAGVIAAIVVGIIGIGVALVLRPATGGIATTTDVIAVMAQNIAIGGVLAIVAGWIGSRAHQDRPAPRR